MMAWVLMGLAMVAALIGASGFLLLGVTDLDEDHGDGGVPPGRARAQGMSALITGVVGLTAALALITGVVGLTAALALAFAAGRV